jgi:hypothetical protein
MKKQDHLWQKPYGDTAPWDWTGKKYVQIFCPFLHSAKEGGDEYRSYENDPEKLRTYHLQKGYKKFTSAKTIGKYIARFKSYKPGHQVRVPQKSFNKKADKSKGFLVEITSIPYHGKINGICALVCDAEILRECEVKDGVRTTLVIDSYS